MLRAHVLVLRIQVSGRSVIEDHTPPRPDDVLERGLGEIKWSDDCLSNRDLNLAVTDGGLRLDPRLIPMPEGSVALALHRHARPRFA